MTQAKPSTALSRLRVLDISRVRAGPTCRPGQHTDDLLHDLGCSDDEIARWRNSKVL
jgi:crotonobetainyl-CoA:carnitine CoA-transferase CaiB-like acyl-CoA transferase